MVVGIAGGLSWGRPVEIEETRMWLPSNFLCDAAASRRGCRLFQDATRHETDSALT